MLRTILMLSMFALVAGCSGDKGTSAVDKMKGAAESAVDSAKDAASDAADAASDAADAAADAAGDATDTIGGMADDAMDAVTGAAEDGADVLDPRAYAAEAVDDGEESITDLAKAAMEDERVQSALEVVKDKAGDAAGDAMGGAKDMLGQ